jgi:hypothetical protein
MGRSAKLRIVGSGRSLKLRLVGSWEREPLDRLCETAHVAGALDKLQRHLVTRARELGKSWTDIGASLGVSKQSAWERFSEPPPD